MRLWYVRDLHEQDNKDFDHNQYLTEIYSDEYALKKIRDGWYDTAFISDGIYRDVELFKEGCYVMYHSFPQRILATVPGACQAYGEELAPGELEATMFKIGCYHVRASTRVYHVYSDKYYPERETPADKEITDWLRYLIQINKEDGFDDMCIARGIFDNPDIRSTLRLTTEIWARYMFSTTDKSWKYVCRTAESEDRTWYEKIINIVSAKNGIEDSKEVERLYVGLGLYGDWNLAETWYEFKGEAC